MTKKDLLEQTSDSKQNLKLNSVHEGENKWHVDPSKPTISRVSSVCAQGTKMELPLWLSKGLYDRKRRVLSVELPKVYREGWRTVFNADPNVVDLHKMGPYYYGLGSQMLHFDSPENPEIGQTLLQV